MNARPNFFAQGRLKVGAMNKTETAYEGVKLRLADNTFYTPDFAVLASDHVLEMHEVKGWWTDDGRAKIKIAAEMYPFRFKAVKARAKRDGGGWSEEAF
jgi:hypothetical protein